MTSPLLILLLILSCIDASKEIYSMDALEIEVITDTEERRMPTRHRRGLAGLAASALTVAIDVFGISINRDVSTAERHGGCSWFAQLGSLCLHHSCPNGLEFARANNGLCQDRSRSLLGMSRWTDCVPDGDFGKACLEGTQLLHGAYAFEKNYCCRSITTLPLLSWKGGWQSAMTGDIIRCDEEKDESECGTLHCVRRHAGRHRQPHVNQSTSFQAQLFKNGKYCHELTIDGHRAQRNGNYIQLYKIVDSGKSEPFDVFYRTNREE